MQLTLMDAIMSLAGLTLSTGGGGYLAWIVSKRRSAAAQSKREKLLLEEMASLRKELERRRASDPPSAYEQDRDRRRTAARSAGYEEGDTARFDKKNMLEGMRCDACEPLHKMVDEVRLGMSASANSASVASAAVIRMEESVEKTTHQVERTMEKMTQRVEKTMEKFGEKLESFGQDQVRLDERLKTAERDISWIKRTAAESG